MPLRRDDAGGDALDFARWLEKLGDGVAGREKFGPPDREGKRRLRFPRDVCLDGELDDLIDWTFEGFARGETNVGDNIILTTTNVISEHVNENVATQFPGNESHHLLSSDALDAEDADQNAVPEEELNRNLPQGMPPHALKVKVGTPLILLRKPRPVEGIV